MGTRKLTDAEYQAGYAEAEAETQWGLFRRAVKPLCCREKLRPKHWQRALYDYFVTECMWADALINEEGIRAAIIDMMESSRPWCNPQVFDEAQARVAMRKALDTILVPKDSTGTGVQPVDGGQLSEPVDVTARTAELVRELDLEGSGFECLNEQ